MNKLMYKQEQEKSNYSELKKKAEISLQKAKEIILRNIPIDEVSAIYVKGSYVQDELTPASDVDVVVILKSEKYLLDVYKLTEDFGNSVNPPFQAVAYTLGELQTGKWITNRIKKGVPVSVFVKRMDQLPIIYGLKPKGKFFTRSDEKELSVNISVFRKNYLPGFENGTFKFDELVKATLWLVEREQRALGRKPDYSWQKLSDLIKNKNHIVHDALKLRRQNDISQQEQDDFLKKLNDYLDYLETKYKQ